MSDLFSSNLDNQDFEEDFEDTAEELLETTFDPFKEIILKYGTESARVDITSPSYVGKSLVNLAILKSEELGISRNPKDLNYKYSGDYVEGSTIPAAGREYIISASRDTKGN